MTTTKKPVPTLEGAAPAAPTEMKQAQEKIALLQGQIDDLQTVATTYKGLADAFGARLLEMENTMQEMGKSVLKLFEGQNELFRLFVPQPQQQRQPDHNSHASILPERQFGVRGPVGGGGFER